MQEDMVVKESKGVQEQSGVDCSRMYDIRTEIIIAGAIVVIIVGVLCW